MIREHRRGEKQKMIERYSRGFQSVMEDYNFNLVAMFQKLKITGGFLTINTTKHQTLMSADPKKINEIKDFLLTARRKDARSVKIKRSKDVVKFKVRCSKYLYNLCVFDTEKGDKLKQSLPPACTEIIVDYSSGEVRTGQPSVGMIRQNPVLVRTETDRDTLRSRFTDVMETRVQDRVQSFLPPRPSRQGKGKGMVTRGLLRCQFQASLWDDTGGEEDQADPPVWPPMRGYDDFPNFLALPDVTLARTSKGNPL
ncbi:hypothetical protein GIB67_001843 [Kingdonia uniflora]|uniref:60S ribosomal protein L38 n=1 Tax=Kingdonia uniflora TaxID=39325 RepID=A0A7J7LC11_9MAGN|nr:hypothetical protein GIB67_001843 [Kingdonia uniflora]